MEKYKNKGLSGLGNLGNTCFMNTCMQLLSNTYKINEYLDDKNYCEKIIKNNLEGNLLKEWNKLRELMWKENCIISPGAWLQSVHNTARHKNQDLFTGFMQNDLHEFLSFVIDCFHEALKRPVNMEIKGDIENSTDKLAVKCYTMMKNMYNKEYSEVLKTFFGIHVSEITTIDNLDESLSITPEPYFMVELPIPADKRTCSIYDCFDLYTKPEKLVGDDAWFNEETNKKQDVNKRIIYWNFPEILVIILKRFTNDNKKIQKLIDFPIENLNLSKYVKGYNKDSYVYDLYGIANHSGNALGGHYFAYIKNANNQWYNFNDTNVTKIENIDKTLISSKAYVFFYTKKKV
jgi:ubiquitin C-terminal hydrolase